MKPTVKNQLDKLNPFERSLVEKYTEPTRMVEYLNEHCCTVGMALCYLFNWKEASTNRKLGELFWLSVANKYK
jgi:hypothetical protein